MGICNEKPRIVSVKDLLNNNNLTIPNYQRPYKWAERNVNQLIDDIICNTDKSSYRIGTLVIHREEVCGGVVDNIVDGQQRTITLTLIALALVKSGKLVGNGIVNRENPIESFLPKFKLHFSNIISQTNIQNNYRAVLRRINEFNEKEIRYFYSKCELVQVILNDVSEAFQFFDSQNARGKDLEPHDLLKAFHLREMNCLDEGDIIKTVSQWENFDPSDLNDIFAHYLYRIRNWGKDNSARDFTKDDVGCFKGVSLNDRKNYPFSRIYRIANYYTDDYNHSVFSKVNDKVVSYPFQIDQCVVNGKPFFEMVSYYVGVVKLLKDRKNNDILSLIQNYDGCERTGDRYVRELFYAGLLYYIDRFGDFELNRAIVKIFVWAYTLRLCLYSVTKKSVDNYALDTMDYTGHSVKLFRLIREATSPNEILNLQLGIIKKNNSTKTGEIENKLKELNYYEATT